MVDQVLAFIVVIAPTVFAIGIEVIDKRIREHPYWRFGIIAFGLTLSGLTWFQLSRETAARENAIRATSQQVAAETSTQVTKAVTEQYAQMVADQKKQISDLQRELAAQRKDVATIKGSNIVTGKSPIKVEVTNEPSAPAGRMQVENIRLFWEQENSTHADAPYAKKVTVQSDAPINPVKLAIICDSALKYGEGGPAAGTRPIMWYGGNEIYKNDSKIFIINMTSQGQAVLTPDAPLVFHLYSDKPINVLKFERGPR